MKLSDSFSLSELTASSYAAGGFVKPNDKQIFCLKKLCENLLQPIRNQFGLVRITSGLRDMEVYHGLIKAKLPASKTSDHFAWSEANPYGTGAADFYCPNADLDKVYKWIKSELNDKIGQLIIYPSKGFIHVSNSWSEIFSMPDPGTKVKYLVYSNGKFNKDN